MLLLVLKFPYGMIKLLVSLGQLHVCIYIYIHIITRFHCIVCAYGSMWMRSVAGSYTYYANYILVVTRQCLTNQFEVVCKLMLDLNVISVLVLFVLVYSLHPNAYNILSHTAQRSINLSRLPARTITLSIKQFAMYYTYINIKSMSRDRNIIQMSCHWLMCLPCLSLLYSHYKVNSNSDQTGSIGLGRRFNRANKYKYDYGFHTTNGLSSTKVWHWQFHSHGRMIATEMRVVG